MHVYSSDHGTRLVEAARNSIELFLTNPHFDKELIKRGLEEFQKPHGLFVTLEHYPTRELRGCLGFARPVAPLGESLVDAAIAAAFEDSRYVSVSKRELDDLLIEVSILSSLTPVTGGERKRLSSIEIGRDGLMVEYGVHSGLLLPMVAADQKWGKKKFLEETCKKAGVHLNYWAQPNVKLYKFETQTFREEEPRGRIIEVKYHKD